MRCHYEVLEVERTADDDEIKKAYRKLALKWHPDKNPDRIEECNQMFTLLQQAYEVLSDPQERAWYDRHRDRILRGGFDEEYKDNSINLFPYSSSTCYSGFGDDEKGFYAVYRHVFETLASEDYEFLEDALETYPGFGDSTSDYEEVVGPFYGFWQSFSTSRSFSWLDEYEIRDAPNRYVVRQMEKENKKMRDAGKKERNEEIRHLAEYVRKRDKRVTEYKKVLEERRLEQERKNEENRRNMILERNRQLGEYKESEEVKKEHQETLAEIEEALDAQFGTEGLEGDGLDDDGDVQPLYCIVCEKAFKTAKAMSNHEKSKKHREAVEELKKHMQEEDLVLLEDEQRDEAVDNDDAPKASSKKTKKQRRRERRKADLDLDDSDNADNGEGEATSLNGQLNGMTLGDESTQGDEVNANIEDETNIFLKMAKAQVKAAEKEGKKKTRRRENASDGKVSEQQPSGPRPGTCDKCGEVFESKTKLFTHLKASGHATILAGPTITNGTAKPGKRAKRK